MLKYLREKKASKDRETGYILLLCKMNFHSWKSQSFKLYNVMESWILSHLNWFSTNHLNSLNIKNRRFSLKFFKKKEIFSIYQWIIWLIGPWNELKLKWCRKKPVKLLTDTDNAVYLKKKKTMIISEYLEMLIISAVPIQQFHMGIAHKRRQIKNVWWQKKNIWFSIISF